MNETIYRSSAGEFVTGTQVWERSESGEWTPCCWDDESGKEWVETDAERMLCLTPVSPSELPDDVRLERVTRGVVVEDERRLLA
jgi:hypothetical protein